MSGCGQSQRRQTGRSHIHFSMYGTMYHILPIAASKMDVMGVHAKSCQSDRVFELFIMAALSSSFSLRERSIWKWCDYTATHSDRCLEFFPWINQSNIFILN